MKTSGILLATLRETPAATEAISHQLMLRAGMIRQLASGIYAWLPLGLRVLRKVEMIIREEMDKTGAQELLLSGFQPAELWQESGRWDEYGPELLRLSDRHGHKFCFAPTHEEIISDLVRREIRSYKQLPANFYQIQTKFRDEIRPRFGVMRAREFLMKDAYSFHLTKASLLETYEQMFQTYSTIFSRLGLRYRAVLADSGNIGGAVSHEFHVLANTGEERIVFSNEGDYAANIEQAVSVPPQQARPAPSAAMQRVETPGQHSIEAISQFLKITAKQCLKTLIVQDRQDKLVALVIRGDHELNLTKVDRLAQIANPVKMADEATIQAQLGCRTGSIGPLKLGIPLIADHHATRLADFVCGANEEGKHYTGVNWKRDLPEPISADIRNVQAGDLAADGSGRLEITRGIEVGHIFQLGQKYSKALRVKCLDEKGEAQTLFMGCYGIGVSRIVAAAVEQNHDQRGIIWPAPIAPFQLALLPIYMHKSQRLRDAVLALYQQFCAAGVDSLLDDRKERPGIMFSDTELIGIPHRLVLSEKNLDKHQIEYQHRDSPQEKQYIDLDKVIDFILERLKAWQHPGS